MRTYGECFVIHDCNFYKENFVNIGPPHTKFAYHPYLDYIDSVTLRCHDISIVYSIDDQEVCPGTNTSSYQKYEQISIPKMLIFFLLCRFSLNITFDSWRSTGERGLL